MSPATQSINSSFGVLNEPMSSLDPQVQQFALNQTLYTQNLMPQNLTQPQMISRINQGLMQQPSQMLRGAQQQQPQHQQQQQQSQQQQQMRGGGVSPMQNQQQNQRRQMGGGGQQQQMVTVTKGAQNQRGGYQQGQPSYNQQIPARNGNNQQNDGRYGGNGQGGRNNNRGRGRGRNNR